MRDNERLSWNIFLRFIVSNLMILFPALVGSVAAYVLASRTMFEVADNIVGIHLGASPPISITSSRITGRRTRP